MSEVPPFPPSTTPLRVCIVGLKCFDHIARNRVPRYLGGIETQLAVLARALARVGASVSLITYDHGQEDDLRFEGVRVLKSFKPAGGVPGLKWIHPRTTQLWKAMRRADADVYLQMGAGLETGQVAWGCRRGSLAGRRFVFCLASDANYTTHLRSGFLGWEGRAYQSGLRHADLVIAQTESQRLGLRQALGLDSKVVPMAVEPPAESPPVDTAHAHPASNHVLWVGRITPGKRLEWLLELARHCPSVHFDVVGTPNKDSAYATEVLRAAATLPNVTVHGRVSGDDLRRLYRQARLLCCTSTLEGFPTTFLEAWSLGLPVVTTFDPDGVVQRHGLGRVATDPASLASAVTQLLGDQGPYEQTSRQVRDYFATRHTPEAVARQFQGLLRHLAVLAA